MTKLTKSQARAKYNKGEMVTLVPSKMRPGGVWNVGIPCSNASGREFDALINEFKFYNCNKAAGLGVGFYA